MVDSVILHIAPQEKFIPAFIDFMETNFPDFEQRHRFWIQGDNNEFPVKCAPNIIIEKRYGEYLKWAHLLKEFYRADKIILHGLFRHRLVQLLAAQPWLLKRCYWVMWGADLYCHELECSMKHWARNEKFRKFVIKRLGHLVTYLSGDVELARKWYGARGEYNQCFMYPSNLYQKHAHERNRNSRAISIQIGNSADPSNNHLEMLDFLAAYKEENIKVYAPLSYGCRDHAAKVARVGLERLGEKFVPLLEFMPFAEYLDFLRNIDIALFNHNRQQGMGNSIALLGMGKKLYMRTNVSQHALFNEIDIRVFDIEQFELSRISPEDARHNAKIVESYFCKSNLVAQYMRIFDE